MKRLTISNVICRLAWIIPILLVSASPVRAAAGHPNIRTMDPVSFVEMPRLEGPTVSPDGSHTLLVRSEVDWAKNKRVDRHQIVNNETLQTINLPIWELDGQSLSSGIWSPDGRGFIALLELEDDKKTSAYYYDVKTANLSKIFEHTEDIKDVSWTENGEGLYFRARRHDKRSKQEKSFEIRPYDLPTPSELWKYSRGKNVSESIIAGKFNVSGYSLSENGSKILHGRIPEGGQYAGHDRELWLHDTATGKYERLTDNQYRESDAKISPDGSLFAYIATVNEKGEGYYEDNLFLQKVGSNKPRLLMPDEPMEVLDFAWDADGKSIFVLGNIGVRTELFSLDLTSNKLERMTTGDHEISDWQYNTKTGQHVAMFIDAKTPGEIYLKRDRNAPFTKITTEYDDWKKTVALPNQSVFRWKGRDGQKLEGILVLPVGHIQDQKVPLVTITHGGPRTSSQFGNWRPSRSVPVLAGLGYAIFLPNHRGGTGYGDAFMRDMVGNYFRNSHLDILDGIDALIAEGIADPDKLIKMGWSAGGHMTNKLITFTDRFKAASSGAGASSWISMYGESDVRHNRTPWFGGAPWQENAPMDNFVAQSPLKDAWRVKTPTLFFNGEDDVRVPPTQQIMMYRGVRATDTPTNLYVAKNEPHGYQKPINQLFKINAELGWFAKHVLGQEYTPVLPEVAVNTDDETGGASMEPKNENELTP